MYTLVTILKYSPQCEVMFKITTEHHCYTVMFRLSFCEEQWPYLISAKDADYLIWSSVPLKKVSPHPAQRCF